MDNLSNMSTMVPDRNTSTYVSPLSGPGFVVFNMVLLVVVVLPVVVLNGMILLVLLLETSTARVVRLALGSILVSCLIVALGLAMYHISGIVLNLAPVDNPSSIPCTITVFLIAFGSAARLVFMATFAVTVYTVIKHSFAVKRRAGYIALAIIALLWAVSFLGSSPILSEVVTRSFYVDSLSCGPVPTSVASYIYVAFYVFVFGVVSFIMTVVLLIVTVCYVKQRTVPGNRENALGMIKFGFFLMLGNALNIIAQILPQLLAALIVPPSAVSVEEYEVIAFEEGIYAAYALFALSLIPTPICMLIFFSRLRQKLTSLFYCRKQEVDTSQSAGTMDTKESSTRL